MKLTLQITASAATLAHILSNLPADAEISSNDMAGADRVPLPLAPAPAPSAAVGHAAAPGGMPAIPPLAPAAAPTDGDDGEGEHNADAPDVDSKGMPWDQRIHAGTKATNKDGSWRYKRGVDEGLVQSIEAELRGNALPAPSPIAAPVAMPSVPMQPTPPIPAPAPIAPIPAPAPAPFVPPPPPMPATGEPAEQPAAAVQAQVDAITAPGPAPAPQPTGVIDFAAFMQHISVKMGERDAQGTALVHPDYLAGVTTEISNAFQQAGHITTPLNSITDINGNQPMIDYAVQVLQRDGRW